MIRNIIKKSIQLLLSYPKLIRLSFFTTFGHTIYRTVLILMIFNNIVQSRTTAGVDYSEALTYIFNKLQEFNIVGFIVTFIIIVIIWNFWIYPIGEGSMVYALNSEDHKLIPAIAKGLKKFFVMLKFDGLSFAFGIYTITTITIRLVIMDILNNPIVATVMILRGIFVLLASILMPYTKYYILQKGMPVFEAIRKSGYLAFSNLWLTIRGLFFELILMFRFVLNALIIIIIPFLLISLALHFKVMDQPYIEKGIWIITGIVILFVAYINGIFEPFFANYWLKIFENAEQHTEE